MRKALQKNAPVSERGLLDKKHRILFADLKCPEKGESQNRRAAGESNSNFAHARVDITAGRAAQAAYEGSRAQKVRK